MRQCVLHTANPLTPPPYPVNWQLKWKTGITFSHCWNLFRLSLQQHVHPKCIFSMSPKPPQWQACSARRNDCCSTAACLFIGGCQDVAQTKAWFKRGGGIALNTARPTDYENIGNETLSSYLFSILSLHRNKVWVCDCNSCTKQKIHTMKSKQIHWVKCFFFWHLLQFPFLCISTFAKSNLAYQFTLQVPMTFSFYFLSM